MKHKRINLNADIDKVLFNMEYTFYCGFTTNKKSKTIHYI